MDDIVRSWKYISSEQFKAGEKGILTKSVDIVCKTVSKEERTVEIIVTSPSVDRDNDSIDINGWVLDFYEKTGPVLWGHDNSRPLIGNSESIKIKNKKMYSIDKFVTREMYDFGGMVGDMVLGGWIKCASIGFRPIDWKFNEKRGGIDFSRQEKLEHSIVNIPSNRDALLQMKGCGINLEPMYAHYEEALDSKSDILIIKSFGSEATRKAIEEARKIVDPVQRVSVFVSKFTPQPEQAEIPDVFKRFEASVNKFADALEGAADRLNNALGEYAEVAAGCSHHVKAVPEKAQADNLTPDLILDILKDMKKG